MHSTAEQVRLAVVWSGATVAVLTALSVLFVSSGVSMPVATLLMLGITIAVPLLTVRRLEHTALAGWERAGDHHAVHAAGETEIDSLFVDGFPVYEVEIDDRRPRARMAERSRGIETVVEVPLQAVERGTGFEVTEEHAPEDALPPALLERVTGLVGDPGQTVWERTARLLGARTGLEVDGGTGVVRFRDDGVVTDPDHLREIAETVVAVAGVVEREAGAGPDHESESGDVGVSERTSAGET